MDMDLFDLRYKAVIEAIECGRIEPLRDDDDTDKYFIDEGYNHSAVKNLVDFIYENLITEHGQANMHAINLIQSSYSEIRIYAGDQDSFGWLVGCFSFVLNGATYIICYG